MTVNHLVECLGPSAPSASWGFILHGLSSTSKLKLPPQPSTPPPHGHRLQQSAHTVNCGDSPCWGWSVNLQPPHRAVWCCLFVVRISSARVPLTWQLPVGPSTRDASHRGPKWALCCDRETVMLGPRLVSGGVSRLGDAKLQPSKPHAGQCLLDALYE